MIWMKIYTKSGDAGTTSLQNNVKVSKSNPRIIAYGVIDELNSQLGIVLSKRLDDDIREVLARVQNDLFIVGADLSNPNLDNSKNRVTLEMVDFLEKKIDNFESDLPQITNFILPGGTTEASFLHYSRAVARRAECQMVYLNEREKINEISLQYINRLSDLLFVIARVINKRNNTSDIIWRP